VFDTERLLEALGPKSMPLPVKFRITLSRTVKLPPEMNWMPVVFVTAVPSSTTPMILILSVAPGALMVIAGLPLTAAIEAQP
jgi:hypothetical protein